MQADQSSGGGLEDRLRGMIISNHPAPAPSNSSPATNAPHPTQGAQPWRQPRPEAQPEGTAPSSEGDAAPTSPRAPRKRPNQAQRRQMSAQLSIPIDPRPEPQTSQPVNHRQPYWRNKRNQQPQSAPFHPAQPGPGFPSSPSIGPPGMSHARHQPSPSYPGVMAPNSNLEWRQPYGQNQPGFPPRSHNGNASFDGPSRGYRQHQGNASISNPRLYTPRPEEIAPQAALLESLSKDILSNAEIEPSEILEKESFRVTIEQICRMAVAQYERDHSGVTNFPPESVQLKCFGSLSSGFATKASDMDLGLLSPLSSPQPESHDSPIPRLIEKAFLDAGYGARLLTRTRVPIIKLCEKPPENLRQGLLEERAKWEKGIDDEHDPHDEDAHQPGAPSSPLDAIPIEEAGHDQETKPLGDAKPHDQGSYGRLLAHLRQPDNLQLQGYYALAKKTLRKLGGRDITHSTALDFGPDDYKILNDVCDAFVRGLADEALRVRLQQYHSLSLDNKAPSPSMPVNRSLAGVLTQIEGEKMVMAWEAREVRERDDHLEKLAQSRVDHWKTIQDKPTFGLDPLSYNKELQFSADQLRKIPSVSLMSLEQRQYESAAQYHLRAVKAMLDLGGHDSDSRSNSILDVVVRQYIAGIAKQDIRNEVAEFSQQTGSHSLRAVARKHKALQLARELEKAVEKGLYRDEDVPGIERYIQLLRGPMRPTTSGDHHFDYVVPVTQGTAALVNFINKLSDPAQMAPNQPRDPYHDKLEFPKTGAGVQCDINFSAHLALHNTLLLRCYSYADPRVRPLVLFVKHWAKVRGINTAYRATLSSYGYVLMVLHYLVNVAQPFVCPNLQELAPPPDPKLTPQQLEEVSTCKGRDVRFWRDEVEIQKLAQQGILTPNRDPVGYLLRGFFEYYANSGMMSTVPVRGFDWGRDVLSLRTHGGLLTKQAKGWTGAKTVFEVQNKGPSGPPPASEPQLMEANPASPSEPTTAGQPGPSSQGSQHPTGTTATAQEQARGGEVKEVRYRYLFAIEDPFETDHNVARTVTHNGIVAIRDEFRRAWRIIRSAGKGAAQEDLLRDITTESNPKEAFSNLLLEIHGREIFEDGA